VRIKAAPVLDSEGHVTAAVTVSEEVTEVKQAELAQRLLAEAGATLAASLDYEKTLQDVAQLAVPGFADWCGVELVAPDGGLDQVALAHVDPDKLALGKRMRERYPPDLEAENGLGAVLGGETVLWPEIPDELLVDSAQSEEHLRIARTLQEGLLPPSLEAPPGWETAVLFRAAGSANEVGGDFYDIIQLGDSWLTFVGDVAGKGAHAAALTARARYTMISVAQLTGRADAAVDRVNDAFLDMDGSSLCTLAALRLFGAEPGGRVEVLSAGHPLPYLVTNDGGATPLGTTGPLLGFVRSPRWPHATAEVAPGEAVVLFSDGVLDTVSEDRRHFGEHRLVDLLRSAPVHSAAELVERLDRALLDFQGSEQRDDVAVLVLRRR